MRAVPPRLPEQPIFYPVLSEDWAFKIARDCSVRAERSRVRDRFEVREAFLDGFDVQLAGGRAHREYRIPAEGPPDFNVAIVGAIEVVRAFGHEDGDSSSRSSTRQERSRRRPSSPPSSPGARSF